MHGHVQRFAGLSALVLLLNSCGSGQQAFLDRVQPLSPERAHPLFREISPLMEHPGKWNPDDLIRTWKDYLGDTPVPLRQNTATTFVYYDFTGTMNRVFLETSFAPGRPQALWRVGSTSLFFRTYDIFRPEKVLYRFSDGTRTLPDPFNPDLQSVDGLWQRVTDPDPTTPTFRQVVGASESGLAGQNLSVLLPQAYDRNLSWTYPFLVVIGLDGETWNQSVAPLMQDNLIRPVILFSLGTKGGDTWNLADLRTTLETRVIPWIRGHYRVSTAAPDMILVGWGKSAKVVQDLAASRPEFWTKTWVPVLNPGPSDDAWNILAPAYLRSQFAVAAP